MDEMIGKNGRAVDDRGRHVGEILRSSGLPIGISLIMYAHKHGSFRMQEFSTDVGISVHGGRSAMNKLQKLGVFVKLNLSARDVVYTLTGRGSVVARCIDTLMNNVGHGEVAKDERGS